MVPEILEADLGDGLDFRLMDGVEPGNIDLVGQADLDVGILLALQDAGRKHKKGRHLRLLVDRLVKVDRGAVGEGAGAAHAIGDVTRQNGGDKGLITVTTSRKGDSVEIRVADTGTGIPKSIQSKIFDPFFTTKGVGKGTGQGLAIAHSVIVDKHSGDIWFESEPGAGTVFIIQIPIEASPSTAREKNV